MTKFTFGPEKPLITVETMVNGEGPFSFIADTRATHTVISTQTAEKPGLVEGLSCRGPPHRPSAQGAGGPAAARLTTIESLRLGDSVKKHRDCGS